MTKKRDRKVGLVLGGGAARGLAHIGVLEVLEEENIPIDMIAGTSVGAAIGAMYALGKSATEIHNLALELSRKSLSLVDPSFPRSGLIKGKKLTDLLKASFGGNIQFSDLKIPFACVATDIATGEEVVLGGGSVAEAIRASISIPGVFTAAKWENRYLVDGDLVNPVPVSAVRRMGADFIIAVNVIPDVADRAHWLEKEKVKSSKEPNLIHIIMQSIYIGTQSLVNSCLRGANIVIEPYVVHFGTIEFHHVEELVQQGKLAAQESIPEIKRQLSLVYYRVSQSAYPGYLYFNDVARLHSARGGSGAGEH